MRRRILGERAVGRGAAAVGLVGALVGALGLSACGGSLFRSKLPPPAIYQLSAVPASAASAGASIPVDLTIQRPRVRTGIDSDRIAVLYPDRRLDYLADARWSGPVDELMQDLALQAFRARANLRSVQPDESTFTGGYWLEIDVTDFQAEYGAESASAGGTPPVVHVRLLASLGAAGDRRMLGRFEANVSRPAAANRVTAIVEAYGQAVDEALGKVVAATAEALEKQAALAGLRQ